MAQRPDLRLVPALPREDDARLLARVKAGERSAAGAFHDRVRPVVDRTVRRLLGGRDPDAEDVAQQVMIELVTSADRYRGEGSLDGWVAAVAAHVVYKAIRRRRTERGLFAELLVEPSRPAASASPALRNVLGRVAALLDDMEEGRAWAFVLHEVMGFDLEEIAAMAHISVAAAQSRLSRGRRELHERIAKDPELAQALGDWEESS